MGRLDLDVAVSAVGDTLTLTYPIFVETHIMDTDFVVQVAPKRTDLVVLGHPMAMTEIKWTKETALGATSAADLVDKIIALTPAPEQFMNRFTVTNISVLNSLPTLLLWDQVLHDGSGFPFPSFQIGDGWEMPNTSIIRFTQTGRFWISVQVVNDHPGFLRTVGVTISQDGTPIFIAGGRLNNPTKERHSAQTIIDVTSVPSDVTATILSNNAYTDANNFAVGFDQVTIFRLVR